MQVRDHKLGEWNDNSPPLWEPFPFKESPNQSGGFRPKGICVHYTAGMTLDRAVRTLTNKRRRASAHLVIGRDGEITQLVGFDRKAWHAGKSLPEQGNKDLFGIELVNAGWLTFTGGRYFTWSHHEIPERDVIVYDDDKCWQTYTHPQIEALIDVCEALIDEYGVWFITGHSDVAIPKNRKVDPGPACPMDELDAVLFPTDSRCDEDD